MKKAFSLLLLLLPALAWAQATVDAKEILGKINRAKASVTATQPSTAPST
jgi:hypothetical protein